MQFNLRAAFSITYIIFFPSVFVLQRRDSNSATLLVCALLAHGNSSGEHIQCYKTTGNKCVRVHVSMPERYSCCCTSAGIPVVHNIYVIPFGEQSVFKSDYKIFFLNYFVTECSLTLTTGFNKDWVFTNK